MEALLLLPASLHMVVDGVGGHCRNQQFTVQLGNVGPGYSAWPIKALALFRFQLCCYINAREGMREGRWERERVQQRAWAGMEPGSLGPAYVVAFLLGEPGGPPTVQTRVCVFVCVWACGAAVYEILRFLEVMASVVTG